MIAAVAAQVVVAAAAAAVMTAVVVASVAAAAAAAAVVAMAAAMVLPSAAAAAANEWSARNILFQHIIVTLTFLALSINFCGCPIIVSRSAKKTANFKKQNKINLPTSKSY